MSDPISNTFSALADPTRRAILARLALGETSVTELAEPFEMSMPAVSKHLRVLENAGLVERSRQAQYRPVKLRAEPLRQAWGWIEEYRQFWEESFDRLDAYLKRLQAEEAKGGNKSSNRTKRNGTSSKGTKETKHARKQN
jgi:DNA-binding transcriptional ArsR family regulator